MKNCMNLYNFITTKKKPDRYFRHIAFWSLRYYFILQSIFGAFYFFGSMSLIESLGTASLFALYSTTIEILFTYTIVYWLIPKYFKNRKFLFFIAVIFLSALLVLAESPVYIRWFQLDHLPAYSLILFWECANLIMAISHVICILFIACVLFKKYYMIMVERDLLAGENTRAEIQLLKAQVHPHFLFNTLNNIYSFTLRKSPESGALVLKLTDTLKYMVRECNAPFVAVKKELKFLEDYIGLEKVRYGNRLDIDVKLNGNCQEKFIAPLLMIPFVENCFKHGASKTLRHPWVKLKIDLDENFLHMQLSNSKPSSAIAPNGRNGIGLKNVKKRLEILYPANYQLSIKSDEYSFTVDLKIPFQDNCIIERKREVEPTHFVNQNSAYA